jgi:hypothetical protein
VLRLLAVALFCVLFCLLLPAQQQPQISGYVIDKTTREPVAGANVTLYTYESERYRATTDDSGAFQLSGVDKRSYEVAVEKSGFVLFAKQPLQIGDMPVAPTYELEFSETPKGALRGSILDSQGKPMANAIVDLIRGPSLVYRRITDSDGRFSFEKVGIGSYKLRAAPPMSFKGFEVATYFPGWTDESAAGRFELQGEAQVQGFRLATSRGVHLYGTVRDEDSHPVANAIVKLHPINQQPAHVVVSFDGTFFAVPEGDAPGPAEAELRTNADGAFDFPSVRVGGWQIVAQSENRSGSVPVNVSSEDVALDIPIKAPAMISSVPISWAVSGCTTPLIDNPCDANAPKTPEGVAYWTWFESVDGQASALRFARTDVGIAPDEAARPGKIHGTVTNKGSGAMVAIAYASQGYIWGKLTPCHLDGTFDFDLIGILGDYGIAAFRTMDLERLRDPAILQKILSSKPKIRVTEGSTTEVRLPEIF